MVAATIESGFTVADLDAMPADGRRYELIGGAIVVTPAPEPGHQRGSRRLQRLLEDACPDGYEVFDAPVDLDLPSGERVEPDIVVVPLGSVGQKRLITPVLLVVEIVSPGSRTNDYVTKRATYAEAGIPHYWIIDSRRGRTLALRLASQGRYDEVCDATGQVSLTDPISVTFDAAELVQPPRR